MNINSKSVIYRGGWEFSSHFSIYHLKLLFDEIPLSLTQLIRVRLSNP